MATEIHLLYIDFDCESSVLVGAFDDRARADRECAILNEKNASEIIDYRVDTVPLLAGCDAFNPGRFG